MALSLTTTFFYPVLAVRTRLEEASQAARRSLKAIAKILVTMERKDLLIIMEKADQYSRDIASCFPFYFIHGGTGPSSD